MPSEDWKLGGDLGRIVGLGLVALIAGWLYTPGMCDDQREATSADPVACLLNANDCD